MADLQYRRSLLKLIASGTFASQDPARTFARQTKNAHKPAAEVRITGDSTPALRPFDDLMTSFMTEHRVPGAALAVTRQSKLVYSRGFGYADVDVSRAVQPESRFRIASISKPLTAVAVMQSVMRKKLALDDRAFDILPTNDWLPKKHDERLRRITVRQLLQHTGGWDRNASFDPITRPREAAKALGKSLPVGPADILRYTLTLPLDFDPGDRHAYSNVGYLLLGRVIEHVTAQPYEEYVKSQVLAPVGIKNMRLGRAWRGDLAPGEVCYFDSKHREGPAVNGPRLEAKVPIVYGAENFEAFEAHGGWIASAVDLVKFASAFDDPANSRLLDEPSIAAMFARPTGSAGSESDGRPKAAYYGCGWSVRTIGDSGRANTWHTGLIAGTSTILVRRHDGLNWAVLFNTDSAPDGRNLSGLIDPLVHAAANAVKHWP